MAKDVSSITAEPSLRNASPPKFKINSFIARGSFGSVYRGEKLEGHLPIAVKVESLKAKVPMLQYEAKIYKMLANYREYLTSTWMDARTLSLRGGSSKKGSAAANARETSLRDITHSAQGIPRIHWFGSQGSTCLLVMDLLGPSIESIFQSRGRRLPLPSVLLFLDQALGLLQVIHTCGLLHRDIKPDNFLVGREKGNRIFVVDFGLAKRFCDSRTRAHIPWRENKALTGTPRYASINNHLGVEQGRRDDLESLGYVAIYLLRGKLPWQGLRSRNLKHKMERIMHAKMGMPTAKLCSGLPSHFYTFFEYVRALRFADKPDYVYLRKLFRVLGKREGVLYEYGFQVPEVASTDKPRLPDLRTVKEPTARIK